MRRQSSATVSKDTISGDVEMRVIGLGKIISKNKLTRTDSHAWYFWEYRLPTSLKAFWVDTLFSLPLLHQSSCNGCEFCSFLRTIILSTDTSDAAEQAFGKTLEDMGSSRVEIWAQYYWEKGERWDEEEEKHQASAEKHDEGSHSPSALTCSNSIPHGNFRNAAPGMDVMSDERVEGEPIKEGYNDSASEVGDSVSLDGINDNVDEKSLRISKNGECHTSDENRPVSQDLDPDIDASHSTGLYDIHHDTTACIVPKTRRCGWDGTWT